MSFRMDVKVDRVLEEDTYDAILDRIEEKTITFKGEESDRLMWVFRIPSEDDTTVVGFTSMSPSTKAKAFKWATALNPEIAKSKNWGPEDLEGKPCRVDLETYEDAQGIEKNKVDKVKPAKSKATEDNEKEFDELPPF
jgi:hypothetical protein